MRYRKNGRQQNLNDDVIKAAADALKFSQALLIWALMNYSGDWDSEGEIPEGILCVIPGAGCSTFKSAETAHWQSAHIVKPKCMVCKEAAFANKLLPALLRQCRCGTE